MITLRAAIIVASLLLAALGVQTWRLAALGDAFDRERLSWAQARAAAESARSTELLAARTEETRRRAAQQEVIHATEDALAKARSDAAAARGAAQRLRDYAAQLAAAASTAASDTAAAEGGAPAAGPGLVLLDLFRRVDDTAGELASALDESRARGIACERAYDSLGGS